MSAAAEAAPRQRAWRPAPAIALSLLLHAGGLIALAIDFALWPWVLGTIAANHVVLFTAVFWPRGRLLGPNLLRLPAAAAARREVCLTFDDGPDPEVTPRVLDVLDRYGMRATFFCVGEKAAAYPRVVKEIVRRGHRVENHSQRHSNAFALYGYRRLEREIDAAQAVIAGLSGHAPRFFRAPMGLRSPLLDPVLARRGLRYVSWTRRGYDAVESDAARVVHRLADGLAAGDILLLHDNGRVRTRGGEPVVLAVLPELLERLKASSLRSVTLAAALDDASAR
jgi:peptidoglycan/xylan/chitin deacetylase (PgdA/CDA1 family)